MANQMGGPDKEFLRKCLDKGLSQQQMVDLWNRDHGTDLSRAAIAMAMSRYGLRRPAKKGAREYRGARELMPWSPMKSDHLRTYIAQMLRLEDNIRAGVDISHVSEKKLKDLESWLRRLAVPQPEADPPAPLGLVVTYVRDSPKGFYYIPAEARDFKGLPDGEHPVIRRPELDEAA